jgi:hypothetical protein
MWNIDIENRIRELNARGDDRHVRLLDTMTETDDSAKSGPRAVRRIIDRVKRAIAAPRHASRPVVSRTV